MTITVNVLTTQGSDPDLYTFLGFIDGAGNDEDPVINDTSTKFNAEVSLFDAVFVTVGSGFTYDKFGRALGTGLVLNSTIVESGQNIIKYTHSAPVKLQDIIDGIVLYSTGNDPTDNFNNVGLPYTNTPATTYLLDNVYMFDKYVYVGNTGDDTFTSGFLDDTLDGKAGNDELHGNQGDDRIEGGAGDDEIDGGSSDFIGDWATYATAAAGVTVSLAVAGQQNTVSAGLDTLTDIEHLLGSKFADTLTGDGNSNFLEGGAGNDTLAGGVEGSFLGDFAFYTLATAAVTVNLDIEGVGQNTGGGGIDTLIGIEGATGTRFNDTLLGDEQDNGLDGFFGNDIINGGLGNDTTYYVFASKGVKVDLSITTQQNTVGYGLDTITNVENLWGSVFSDTLSGNGLANMILGFDGNDVIKGGAGGDTLDGGIFGLDTASYAGSALGVNVDLNVQDGVTAQTGAGDENGDILLNFENLIGSSNNDTLTGDGGNNAINGGGGDDVMTGGLGSDFFRFSNATETSGDSITDFELGVDKIDFALIDAKTGIAGNQKFAFIGSAAFTKAGQLRYEDATGTIEGNITGTSGAEFTIDVQDGLGLTAVDFIL